MATDFAVSPSRIIVNQSSQSIGDRTDTITIRHKNSVPFTIESVITSLPGSTIVSIGYNNTLVDEHEIIVVTNFSENLGDPYHVHNIEIEIKCDDVTTVLIVPFLSSR